MRTTILEYLNNLLEGTTITEFTIKKGTARITINRKPDFSKEKIVKENKKRMKKKEKQDIKSVEEKKVVVSSPTVGVFFRNNKKFSPPIVKPGMSIRKGSVLGFVNCMGVMETIKSPISGKIIEVLVGNNKPVEYGQPLFSIEKE